MRGSRLHGWGQSGQHRGSGSRGGTGRAGTFKHKWTSVLRYGRIQKVGFTSLNSRYERRTINIDELEFLTETKDIQDKKSPIQLDLTTLGYNKLLGRGSIDRPYHIKVTRSSKSAVKKIEQAGGSVSAKD